MDFDQKINEYMTVRPFIGMIVAEMMTKVFDNTQNFDTGVVFAAILSTVEESLDDVAGSINVHSNLREDYITYQSIARYKQEGMKKEVYDSLREDQKKKFDEIADKLEIPEEHRFSGIQYHNFTDRQVEMMSEVLKKFEQRDEEPVF